MEKTQQIDPEELERLVIDRALNDRKFRKLLKTHPRKALKKVWGDKMVIPDDFKIKITVEKPNEMVIVIPRSIKDAHDIENRPDFHIPKRDLNLDNLDNLARSVLGGCTFGCVISNCCIIPTNKARETVIDPHIFEDWRGRRWKLDK